MRWGIPYPLAGETILATSSSWPPRHMHRGELCAGGSCTNIEQHHAWCCGRHGWIRTAVYSPGLSRPKKVSVSAYGNVLTGGRGGATESGQIAVQEQRFLPRSPCATEQQLATRRPAAANYGAVNGSSERRAEIRAGWGIAERKKKPRCGVCGMGKSVSLFDGKFFLIPASNRQERCWCRDSRSSRIGASCSSSSRRTLPFDIRVRVGWRNCLEAAV